MSEKHEPFRPTCFIGDLSGPEGNVFVVWGRVAECLRRFNVERLREFEQRAGVNSGATYVEVLRILREYVEPVYTGMDDEEYLAEYDRAHPDKFVSGG